MTFEELVAKEVQIQIQLIIPDLKNEIRKELQQDKLFKEVNQTLFNQRETAKKMGVCVTTFQKWRKQGLQSEPMVNGELRFDINKVKKWKQENDKRKIK